MKKLPLPLLALAALVVAAGCDFDAKRSGQILLAAGSTGIPLVDRSGAATGLVGGPTELRIRRGSRRGTVAIRARQPGRGEINIEAPIGDTELRGGNFTLSGVVTGQPVDMVSRRSEIVTGPRQRSVSWEDRGFERCRVEVSWTPCDEDWTVDFVTSFAQVSRGTFAARTATQCDVQRSYEVCWRQPDPIMDPRLPHWPRDPRFPRGYYNGSDLYEGALRGGVRFD